MKGNFLKEVKMEIIIDNWVSIVAAVSTVLATLAGYRWERARRIMKESKEFFETVEKAALDKKFTRQEIIDCIKEGGDVMLALKNFWVLILCFGFLASCTFGTMNTNNPEGDGWFLSVFQPPVAMHTAAITSTSCIGMEVEMFSSTNPSPKFKIGYFRYTTAQVPLIEIDEEGRVRGVLGNLIVDTDIRPLTDGMVDTVATGEVANKIYLGIKDKEDKEEVDEEISDGETP